MQMPYFAICEFPNVYLNNSLQKVGCNIIAAQYNRFHDDCYNVSCNFSIGDNIVVWANVILNSKREEWLFANIRWLYISFEA